MQCRYAAIIEQMLEFDMPALDATTRRQIIADNEQQACLCDRAWQQQQLSKGKDPRRGTASWLDDEISQTLLYQSSAQIDGTTFELHVYGRKSMDQLCVFAGEQLRYAEARGGITTGFERATLFAGADGGGARAAVVWRLGAHGEALQLLDLDRGTSVWQHNSDWPVTFEITGRALHYRYYQSDEGGESIMHKGVYPGD